MLNNKWTDLTEECADENNFLPVMKTIGGADVSKKTSAPEKAAAAEMASALENIDFSNVKIEPLFVEMADFEIFSKSDFRAVKVKECEAVPKSKKLLKFVLDDETGEDRVILSGIQEYYEPEELVVKTYIYEIKLLCKKLYREVC